MLFIHQIGCVAVQNLLQSRCCKLVDICLGYNEIHDGFSDTLVKGLAKNATLNSLSISNSHIGAKGRKSMLVALQSPALSIENLDISGNTI